MNKKTIIEREYKDGELIKEIETIEEYDEPKFPYVPVQPICPTVKPWWQEPITVTYL